MTITPALRSERPPVLLVDDDELIARSLRDYLVADQASRVREGGPPNVTGRFSVIITECLKPSLHTE